MGRVNVEVIDENFGEYKKGDTLEMDESTAKACVKNKKVKILAKVKEDSKSPNDAKTKNLKAELATTNETLGEVNAKIEELQTQLSGKVTKLATANEKLGKANTLLTEVQEKLKTVTTSLEKANAEMAKIK